MDIEDLSQLPEHYLNGWDRHHSLSLTTTKGLRNPPGENNCFLNSAVQVFWHLDVFRRSFKNYNGHVCMGNSCIFCNLKVIFTQLRYSDKSSLHPNALRRALAEAFVDQHRFQLGHMDDAAECFENILRRIHFHIANGYNEDQCTATHCLTHRKFALTVSDQVQCVCGASSEPLIFSEIVHYVSVAALVTQANKIIESGYKVTSDKFGLLLRNACSIGDIRDCPKSCGKKVNIRRTLHNQPDVVNIGLVWDSDRPSADLISDVLTNIRTSIVLEDMFHCSTVKDLVRLHLVGIVCYYGKHYSTFVFHSRDQSWYYFDDATVKEMGPRWDSVAEKCCRGHYQPLLLIYANPNATPINVAEAPRKIVMAPGYNNTPASSYIPRSQSADIRRAITPTPDMHCYMDSTILNRRSVTPGPETYRINDCDRDSITSSNAEHHRQPSFLTAISGSEDTESSRASIRSFPMDSTSLNRSLSPSVSNTSSKPSSITSESVDQNLLGEYICNDGKLQATFYNLSNKKMYDNRVYNDPKRNQYDIPTQCPSPSIRDKSFENVNSEMFKTEVRAPNKIVQVNRKVNDNPASLSVPSKYRDDFSLPIDTYKTPVVPNKTYNHQLKPGHVVVKPTAHCIEQDRYYENIKYGPLHSGLATLPRNRDTNNDKKQITQSECLSYPQPPISQKIPIRSENGLQYSNKPASNHSSYEHSSNNIPEPGNMTRSVSAYSLALPKREISKDKMHNTSFHDQEDIYSEETYIDRKTVENVMKKLYLKPPKSTSNGLRHSSRIQENLNGLGNISSATELRDALTLEIPYDSVSLESHRDSGYGSSDRNSSSSSSSITLDPYSQYLPNKGIQHHTIQENQQKFNLDMEKNNLYSGLTGKLTNNATNKNMCLSRKGSIDSILNERGSLGTTFSTDLFRENASTDFKSLPDNALPLSSQNIKSSLLQHGKKILPDKPSSGHIVRDARTKAIIPQNPNPSPANGDDLINFKSGIQNNMNVVQGNKGLVSEEEYIKYYCGLADNMMDYCMAAEAKGDLSRAICDCDKAIGHCRQVLELVNIPHQSVVFMQNKLRCCEMKKQALINDYSTKQQQSRSYHSSKTSFEDIVKAEKARNSMAGFIAGKTSSSCKDNKNISINNSVSCQNYQQLKHVTPVCNENSSEKYLSDSSSSVQCKIPFGSRKELDQDLSESVNNWNKVSVYGTLPKNKPNKIVSKSANQEAEVYQIFLNRQKQLSKENNMVSSYMSKGSRTCSQNFQMNYNLNTSNSNLNKTYPSSSISQPHSRTDSVDSSANSLASCDSAVTIISKLHSKTQVNSDVNRSYKQDVQSASRTYQHGSGAMSRNADENHVKPEQSTSVPSHCIHPKESLKSMMHQENNNESNGRQTNVLSNTSGFPCLKVSLTKTSSLATAHTTPSVVPSKCHPASFNTFFKTNPAQVKPMYSENSSVLPFQSRVVADKKTERTEMFSTVRHSRRLTDACFQPACLHKSDVSSISNNTAEVATRNHSLKVSESNGETAHHLSNTQDIISERLYASDDDEIVRPSVKDLASKFEYDVTNKTVEDNDNVPIRKSFRVRSKSESSTMKPKPALSKHQFQQGSRPRKSVTFADSIATIAPNDDQLCMDHSSSVNPGEKIVNVKYNWDEDDSSCASEDITEVTEGPFCSLCQKKGVQQGQIYCRDCDFYMSRFKPQT